jgi:peptidoglycan/xylan/chitin deacetylase (PgdA/CDA1 family)
MRIVRLPQLLRFWRVSFHEGNLRRLRAPDASTATDSLRTTHVHKPFVKTGPGRPTTRWIAAASALLAGAALAFAGAGASATSSAELSYKQSVTSAHFKASGLAELADGSGYSKLCWNIAAKAGATSIWCVKRTSQTGTWRLTGKRTGVKVRVAGDTALLAVDPQLAGLAAGLYKWDIAITPCQPDPTGATGSSSATGATAAAPDPTCAVHYPKSSSQTIRIRGLQPVGCSIKGPAQVTAGPRSGKKIALTFDDGPAPDTGQFLNELKHLKIHATFFMIGQQVAGHGALLKRMMAEGHELANHSWNHANLGGGGGAATQQITSTNRAIFRASGFRPCLMRPPYGSTGSDLVRRVRSQHMTSVLWDVDPKDWSTPGTGTIVNTIRGQTHAGSIILEHDGGGPRGQTLAALPQYVRTLKSRGYKFVTVNELLGYKTTYKLAGK